MIFDKGSKFKLHFEGLLCDSYGLKHKSTSIKNPQANAILERIHQVLMTMIQTSEIDMSDSVAPSDIDAVLTNASWAILNPGVMKKMTHIGKKTQVKTLYALLNKICVRNHDYLHENIQRLQVIYKIYFENFLHWRLCYCPWFKAYWNRSNKGEVEWSRRHCAENVVVCLGDTSIWQTTLYVTVLVRLHWTRITVLQKCCGI